MRGNFRPQFGMARPQWNMNRPPMMRPNGFGNQGPPMNNPGFGGGGPRQMMGPPMGNPDGFDPNEDFSRPELNPETVMLWIDEQVRFFLFTVNDSLYFVVAFFVLDIFWIMIQ